jgi:hypothetical protein
VYICKIFFLKVAKKIFIYFFLVIFTNTIIFPERCFPIDAIGYEDMDPSNDIENLIDFIVRAYTDFDKGDNPVKQHKGKIPFSTLDFNYLDYVVASKIYFNYYIDLSEDPKGYYKADFNNAYDPGAPERPPQLV